MMPVRISFVFFIGALLLLDSGCNGEPIINTDGLKGKWIVYSAKRNRKLTTTLNEAYFHFRDKNLMVTNILGDEQESSIKIDNNKIAVIDNEPKSYTIRSLTDDTLLLTTEIQNFYFEFSMLREHSDTLNHIEELYDSHHHDTDLESD